MGCRCKLRSYACQQWRRACPDMAARSAPMLTEKKAYGQKTAASFDRFFEMQEHQNEQVFWDCVTSKASPKLAHSLRNQFAPRQLGQNSKWQQTLLDLDTLDGYGVINLVQKLLITINNPGINNPAMWCLCSRLQCTGPGLGPGSSYCPRAAPSHGVVSLHI